MADDRGETRTFNLSEAFLFPKLFRGFRIAIDYRKLLLALVAIGLFYGVGVLTDWIGGIFRGPDVVTVAFQPSAGEWSAVSEVQAFNQPGVDFENWRKSRLADRSANLLNLMNRFQAGDAAERQKIADSDVNKAVGLIRAKIWEKYNADVEQVNQSQDNDQVKATKKINAAETRETNLAELNAKDGQGVFEAFSSYQINRFNYTVQSLVFLPGGDGWPGVWNGVAQMGKAFVWLGKYHVIYAIILGLSWLVLSSVFGGAIARLAAVQAARDEKISTPEAVKFAIRKFISFLSAPLIPFVIVAFVFILTAVPAMSAWLPWVGEFLVALLSPLALIAGFIMALVVIGGIGGLGMMHPTIAVEGSDAFDAISRGFSYVYSRPWRTIFYNGLSVVYGGLCFLFVKLFVFLMLWLTWSVMGALVWGGPDAATGGAVSGDKIAAMWAEPNLFTDMHKVDWYKLQNLEVVGAVGLTIWVGIVISLLAAFVLSYVYSSQTLIYLLLRKRVDATDLDDVYIEETEEEELFEAPAEDTKEGKLEKGPAPDESKPIGAEAPPAEGDEGEKPEGDEGEKSE